MKIYYTRKHINRNLWQGLVWSTLGAVWVAFGPDRSIGYLYPILGALYLTTYFFERKHQYLTIENGAITKHGLVPKRMALDEIDRIKTFCSEYILKSGSKELRIDTKLIKEGSRRELNSVLQNLDLEVQLLVQ